MTFVPQALVTLFNILPGLAAHSDMMLLFARWGNADDRVPALGLSRPDMMLSPQRCSCRVCRRHLAAPQVTTSLLQVPLLHPPSNIRILTSMLGTIA